MKEVTTKFVAVFLFILVTAISVSAQTEVQEATEDAVQDSIEMQEEKEYSPLNHRHEMKIGAGFFSGIANYSILTMYPEFDPRNSTDDILNMGLTFYIPNFNVNYNYRVCNWFGIGATLATDFEMFHTLVLDCDFYYISKYKFSFYGNVGVGAIYSTESSINKQFFPTFGIYPVGVKFGKKAGAFMELGFGNKGIMNFGAFLKLCSNK